MEFIGHIEEVVLVVTLLVLIFQASRDISIKRFQVHQSLNDNYLDLLWRATREPSLNAVWDDPAPARLETLRAEQGKGLWGAWHAMNDDERRLYRFVRLAMETLEHSYLAHKEGWLTGSPWKKWQGTIEVWRGACFFEFVLADARDRLDPEFVRAIES